MKKFSLLLVMIIVLSLFAGCSAQSENNTVEQPETEPTVPEEVKEPVNVTIAGLKGPTSIGMIKLIDEKALNSDEYNVEYVQESAPDALTGKIISGEIQISSLPINLASVLYNKTGGAVQLMAINTVGNLYIVGTDEITSIKDLEGKTIGMSAKGSTPDYVMNYLINQNGLEGKVELDYALDHATLAQTVIAGDTTVALLPEPFATQVMMKNTNVKMLVDLSVEWKALSNAEGEIFTGCIVVNKEFAENNKEFVAEFLTQYETSVNWVIENQADASVLVEKNEVMPSAALVEKAIPRCGITYIFANDDKENINSFYKILFDSNPASVGGVLPDDKFYYSE